MKTISNHISLFVRNSLTMLMLLFAVGSRAQSMVRDTVQEKNNKIPINNPNTTPINAEATLTATDSVLIANNQRVNKKIEQRWSEWHPDAKRAMWLAIVMPGAGQIYNRKYWKLPIVYGGFVGCFYALRWNNQMFHDYSQAYIDLMDNDPQSNSYKQFLHLGMQINESNIDRYKELFRKRKDRYRRWRDLSIFSMIGVYALSIIDAYVDASLSEFDISNDLSLRIDPIVINTPSYLNTIQSSGIGFQFRLRF